MRDQAAKEVHHPTPKQLPADSLQTMTLDTLRKLAKDRGVDMPRNCAKAVLIERLRAAEERSESPYEEESADGSGERVVEISVSRS